MKKKKYKIIRNNRNIYAVKELGNKGYWNNKVKRLLKVKKYSYLISFVHSVIPLSPLWPVNLI